MRFLTVLLILVSGILALHAQDLQYRIKNGDTLSEISMRITGIYRNYMKIAKYNELENPDYIKAGTLLFIPDSIVDPDRNYSFAEPVTGSESSVSDPDVRTDPDMSMAQSGQEKGPVLDKENLKKISKNIMDKIEKMRDERRKHYMMRELIESREEEFQEEAVREDEPVQVALSVNAEKAETKVTDAPEKIREQGITQESGHDETEDYIIRLVDNGQGTIRSREQKRKMDRRWSVGAEVFFQHAPKGDGITGLSRDHFPSYSLRYRTSFNDWVGIRGETWDETGSAGQSLSYDKICLTYRHNFDIREKNNWFVEGGLSFYEADFSYLTAGTRTNLDDDAIGIDVAVGYEHHTGHHVSGELLVRAQVAEVEFGAQNGEVCERLNDIYAGAGLNFYF